MSATKGWRGNLRIADSEAGLDGAANLSNIDSVDTNLDGGLDDLYHLGSRLAQAILEGNVRLSLTIRKRYVDNTWAGYAGVGQTDMIPPEKWVGLYPLGYSSGKPKITLRGKFRNWRLTVPQGGDVVETLDFDVRTMNIGTIT